VGWQRPATGEQVMLTESGWRSPSPAPLREVGPPTQQPLGLRLALRAGQQARLLPALLELDRSFKLLPLQLHLRGLRRAEWKALGGPTDNHLPCPTELAPGG